MDLLNWLYKQDETIVAGDKYSAYGPGDDFWYTDAPGSSQSGITVTPDTSMQARAVQACVRVLA